MKKEGIKEGIYEFNPADYFDKKTAYRLFSILDKETEQLISNVMLPQEEIINLKEEEITEKAFKAAERIKTASESLSPELIEEWAEELKKSIRLEDIIGALMLRHILEVYFHLKGEVTFKWDDPKHKDTLKHITKLVKEVMNETEIYKDLADYIGTNLIVWTLEDIDNALGAEKVAALTDDEWNETFYSYLYDDTSWPLKERVSHLLNIYAQDYARVFIEALDLPNKNLEDIEKLLKISLEKREVYSRLPQSAHTNKMARKLASKFEKAFQITLNGKASLEEKDFKLYLEGINELKSGANTSAVKLFDAATKNCIDNRTTLARIPLKEYMELRGLKDEKAARKQIKADIEVLKRIKLEFKGTGKSRGDWLSISLYGGRAGIYNGIIEFRFTPEYIASIPVKQFMYIPNEYFATNDKYNPHTAYFIRRIAEHKRMNLGKPNENIISVRTLIEASPLFPKYEEINYRFSQFMLEPFERDMDAMKKIKWHYAGDEPENYDEFIKSNVIVTWIDYPDVEKLTQRKQLKKKKNPKKGGVTG